MTNANDIDLDRAHALMMGALDDECSATDRQELDALLEQRPELRTEWQRLRRVKEVTSTMGLAQPPEEVWDRFRGSVLHRAERGLAWILISAGIAILGTVAVWHWIEGWLSMELPIVIRVATAALILGLTLLFVSVLRERWLMHRRDPYSKGVLR